LTLLRPFTKFGSGQLETDNHVPFEQSDAARIMNEKPSSPRIIGEVGNLELAWYGLALTGTGLIMEYFVC